MANEILYDSALRLLAYNGDSVAQYNIANSEKATILDEAKATTAWIYEYLKQICRI